LSSSFQDHDALASSSILPPQWVDDVDGINDVLADVQRLMDVLQSLHASRVGSVFGRDLDDMEVKIEKLTRDITGSLILFSATWKRLIALIFS